MTTNLRQNKEPKYFCYECNFKSSKKSDYTRHISTAKHLMTTKGLQKTMHYAANVEKYIVVDKPVSS